MLIRDARDLDGAPIAVRVGGGHITALAPTLTPQPGERVLDLAGGTLIPGLHDHHLHLLSTAAALSSTPTGPPQVTDPTQLRAALRRARPDANGWIRGIGYHDSVAGPLDRTTLDTLRADVALRIQHRSGAQWMLNTPALKRIGRPDHPTGILFRDDTALRAATGTDTTADLAAVGARLLAYGVTGVTEATPDLDTTAHTLIAAAMRNKTLPQQILMLSRDPDPGRAWPPRMSHGPVKRIIDDIDLDLNELTSWIEKTHTAGHPVAVHCVTQFQLVVTLEALRLAGTHPGDRVEHAAMAPDDLLTGLARAGVAVTTQPNLLTERGDTYLREIPPAEHGALWRVRGLLDAGVTVAGSTDAPFGDLDPWAAMRAARDRRTPSGAVIAPEERISARHALELFLRDPIDLHRHRPLATGRTADLCLLSAGPEQVLAELDARLVTGTVCDGVLYPAHDSYLDIGPSRS